MHSRSALGCMTSLRGRVSAVLTAAVALMLAIGAAAWTHGTRHAIHEEVSAATRVAEQWLNVLIPETLDGRPDGMARLMTHLAAVGRLRANRLEVRAADGELLYASPEPTWKAGRFAPAWFAEGVTPVVSPRSFAAGTRRIVLIPDTSRAVLDAWDDLVAGLGWASAALLLLWLTTRTAVRRALAPLTDIDAALERGAAGRFDVRLPEYRARELDKLARSYNRLADSLDESHLHARQLEQDQALARTLHARLEDERRQIARELHDELGQAITAVRAIAGAIQQRCDTLPQLHGSAQAILAMTAQMQDGVRAILRRLREPGNEMCERIDEVVRNYCALWSECHPGIVLECCSATPPGPIDEETALAVLRLLQESLTNVARHAAATRVDVRLDFDADGLALEVRDDGRGLPPDRRSPRFGMLGMRERVARLDGRLDFESPCSGGLSVHVRLPHKPALEASPDGIHA
ncbi:MAG TPA: histidine kinase [Rhodocyclaceae bacterium]|nr:histidine kinase [Rhodocyclaceae bacterium]